MVSLTLEQPLSPSLSLFSQDHLTTSFLLPSLLLQSLVFAPHPPVVPNEGDVVVKEVRAYVMDKSVEEEAGGGADCHAQKHGHWITSTPIASKSVLPFFLLLLLASPCFYFLLFASSLV